MTRSNLSQRTWADWSESTSAEMQRWVEATLAGSTAPLPDVIPSGPHRRLVSVLQDPRAGSADRAVAVRGWLRAETLRWQNEREALRISWPNPDEELLKRCGFVQRERRWAALPWHPSWLADIPAVGVDTAWWPARRRPDEQVAGDPMLGLVGWDCYSSNAQRDAIRSSLCAAPGSCLAISLPTGAGKSLCAFLPALLPQDRETERLGVTVVVVPIVALQLDLEDRLGEAVNHRVAYRPEEKDVTADIRARCRVGTQGPLIVSPEALSGELLDVLRAAAEQGFLRQFVIDEAHVVLSWGDDFRPAFLQLAGVRAELLNAAVARQHDAFVTLLLSATFTDYHLRWLRTLFGPAERFHIVHAARLRPEPSYWFAAARDHTTRENWLIEAIRHLPRPCIVYATTRETCRRWHATLSAEGFSRLRMMTSKTGPEDRRDLLNQWKRDEVDLVVATSAFGLGVDKGDVRSVVHAELPESVDRFYQDVGRSGRDGYESVSLLVSAPEDLRKIKTIGKPRFISPTYGWERWTQMHTRRVATELPGVFLIPLQAGRDLDMRGDYNRGWNLRTLQLLARLGALEFVAHPDRNWNQVAVRLGLATSLEVSYWHGPVDTLRQELLRDNRQTGELLGKLVQDLHRCRAEVFEECYASPTFDLPVVRACGGCPACRAALSPVVCGRILPRRRPDLALPPLRREDHQRRRDCQEWLGQATMGLVVLPDGVIAESEIMQFLLWAMQAGWHSFVVPEELRPSVWRTALEWREVAFLHPRPPYYQDVLAQQPACWWLEDPPPDWWSKLGSQEFERQVPRLLVARRSAPHFAAEHRKLCDLFAGPRLMWNEWADRFVG